jgi:hypothetical protein
LQTILHVVVTKVVAGFGSNKNMPCLFEHPVKSRPACSSVHCRRDIALLIFGDSATDAAGLEAYARLTADLIQQTDLPAYVIAPPSDPGDLDSPALLIKVYPIQEEPGFTTPDKWKQLLGRLSDEHCQQE